MPFPHEVYKVQRIVPISFHRGVTGQPNGGFPDVDNRGFFRASPLGNDPAKNDHGPVVGVGKGDTVVVKVTREKIEATAPLFVTSSDTGVMTVHQMASISDALTPTTDMFIQITGVDGSGAVNPKIARAQIRHGSNTGPIIGELSVWVFTKLNVNLTPHNVTIQDSSGIGIPSSVNVTAVTDMVKDIWKTCGVTITVAPVVNDTVTFANSGVAAWQAEINTLLSTNFAAGTINAYFINQISIPGSSGVLGLGFSRPNSVAFHTPNPGIILADATASGIVRATDTHWLANDLAHEMGHFFTLEHPDRKQPPHERFDTWAVRMLMHNFNQRATRTDWRNDVGYGPTYRGSLITMKDLVDSGNAVHHSTDNECLTSRTTINFSAGPY